MELNNSHNQVFMIFLPSIPDVYTFKHGCIFINNVSASNNVTLLHLVSMAIA